MRNIYIGTSGYTYSDWRGKFYPEDLKPSGFLSYYAQIFNSVEINMTFYRSPFPNVVKGWYKKTPREFRFVCKGPRYITHIQRLKTTADSLDKFFSPLEHLQEKLICILWQLPPSLKRDISLLKDFLGLLKNHPKGSRLLHAIEFRNETWFNDSVYRILEDHAVGLCWYDAPKNRWPKTPTVTTGSMIYLRFHGKTDLYKGSYPDEDLLKWIKEIRKHEEVRTLFTFFNNDYDAAGAYDAQRFRELLFSCEGTD